MRVLVISSWFPYPPDNGSKLRAYHLLRQLARRHTLTLCSFAEESETTPEHRAPLRAICESVTVVTGHPSKHGRLGMRGALSPIPRSYVQTFSHEMAGLVNCMLPGHDLALGLQVGSSLYLRRSIAIPRVFDEAEVSWLDSHRVRAKTPGQRLRLALTAWKYRRFMRDMVARFERTTVVSDLERKALIRMGADRIRLKVVPNGVEPGPVLPLSLPRVPRVVYPGSMTYSANLDAVRYFLGHIWPLVRLARPAATFAVTGSTAGVDLESLPSREGVTFTGHVADVRSVVAESAACVVPLRLGGGTRLKILEAMAAGTPVVSTSKGAEGLAVTPEHDILLADEPEAFASQLLRLLDDSALAERIARHGRQLVERLYTWDKIGAELNAVLQEAVEAFRAGARSE